MKKITEHPRPNYLVYGSFQVHFLSLWERLKVCCGGIKGRVLFVVRLFPLPKERGLSLFVALMLSTVFIPLIWADGPVRGEEEYNAAIKAIKRLRSADADTRKISDTYLWGAGKCRDAGGGDYAVALFKLAVKQDPSNARAHRLYGDFLMGYRGLYEFARYHYDQAWKLIEIDPAVHEEQEIKNLQRSFQILHRDGKDGVSLFESSAFSVYLEGSVAYGRTAPNHITASAGDGSLVDTEARIDRFLNARQKELEGGVAFFSNVILTQNDGLAFFGEQVDGTILNAQRLNCLLFGMAGNPACDPFLPNVGTVFTRNQVIDIRPDGTLVAVSVLETENTQYQQELLATVNEIQADKTETVARVARDAAELAAIPETRKETVKRVRRLQERFKYDGILTIRFGSPKLPSIRLFGEQADRRASLDLEDLVHPLDHSFIQYGGSLVKNFMLAPRFDLETEVEYAHTQLSIYDTGPAEVNFNRLIADEKRDRYRVQTILAYNMPFRSLKLKLGGTLADIRNFDSKDDASWTHVGTIRYAKFADPDKVPYELDDDEQSSRYRGRRSSQWEVGVIHSERKFKGNGVPTTTEEVYRPFISWEELGLLKGKVDLTLIYDWHHQDVSQRGVDQGGSLILNERTASGRQLTLIPTWVAVYKLYNSDFYTGLESLNISFPTSTTVGKGDYDRIISGVKVEARYVTKYEMAMIPSLTGNYAWYHELDRDDWGFFVQLTIRAGNKKKI